MEVKKIINLAFSYIKYKLGRTILTLFILTFSILGFILTNQITTLYKNANIEMVGINNGYHDFAINYPTRENLKAMGNHSNISSIGNEWVIGSGKSEYGPSVLIYRDDAYHKIDTSLSNLLRGIYPIAENDIAVSDAFANENNLKIGDTFEITYSKYDNNTRGELYSENKSFTITGIVDAPAYAFEAGIVSLALKNSCQIEVENSLVVLNNPNNVTSQIDNIVLEDGINPVNISVNQNLLAAREDNQFVQIFKYIMNLVIFITFSLVIYNLLYFDALSKTRDFGIFRCIGYQPIQLALVLIIQVLIYIFLSYVLAVIVAITMNKFLSNTIIHLITNQSLGELSGFHTQIKASIFLQSLLLIIVTVIPSLAQPISSIRKISPKEAMSYSKDMGCICKKYHKKNDIFVNSKNKLKAYSARCVQRHPRKIAITTTIVFLSGFLISGIIAFNGNGEINTDWIRRWIPGDIKVEDLYMQDPANSNDVEHKTFSSDILNQINLIDGIIKAEPLQFGTNFVKINIENLNQNSSLYQMHESEFANNDDGHDGTMQLCNLYGVKDIERYSNMSGLRTDGVLIDSQLADLLNLKVNDKIQVISDIDNKVVEMPISYIFKDEFPLSNTTEGLSSILMTFDMMNVITGRDSIDRIDLWIDENMDENAVKQNLMSVKEISEVGTITTFYDYAADFYKEQRTNQSLLMIVATTFFIIMIVTCFNAIANNFANRSRETAVIYVIGIDKRLIMKTYLREGLYCILGGIALIILSQTAIILLGQNLFEINFFIFIIYAILDLCIMFFCILSTCGCARKLTKKILLSDLQYE